MKAIPNEVSGPGSRVFSKKTRKCLKRLVILNKPTNESCSYVPWSMTKILFIPSQNITLFVCLVEPLKARFDNSRHSAMEAG